MRDERDAELSRRSALRVGAASLAAGVVTAAALSAEGQPAATSAPAPKTPLRIVLHVSDVDGWPPAFSNLRNLVAGYPDAKLRLVVDGGGVYLLAGKNDMTPLFAKYAADGVEFQACHNALTEKKIDPASVPAGVKVVPAGVVALAEAQRDGYAYVKP